MTLTFHWFLPTYGDSRFIVGAAGTACPPGCRSAPGRRPSPTSARSPATAEQLGFVGALTPTGTWCEDAWLTTAMLSRGHRAAEVPRRLPARADLPDAGRADGRDLPAALRRAAAAQRGHRRRGARAARATATTSTRTPATPAPTSSSTSSRGSWDGAPGRLHRRAPAGRGRDGRPRARPACRRSTSAGRRGRRTGRRQARRRLPDLGRAARAGRREDRLDAALAAEDGPQGALRHPAAHHHPRHRRGGLGGGGPLLAASTPRSRASRRGWRAASPRGSAGCSPCTGAAPRRPADSPQPVGRRRPGGGARARLSSAATTRSPTASPSTPSASTSSSSPAPARGGGLLVRRGRAALLAARAAATPVRAAAAPAAQVGEVDD